jgi:glucosamine--fructose-6-phosphate aminotransferase (isomerizing)
MAEISLMRREIDEIPAAAERCLSARTGILAAGAALAAKDPPVIVTAARGSSDNAAAYFKYACEITAGVPVASIGPSIASIYATPPRLSEAALIAVSQSGRSPDIIALAEATRRSGGLTVAVVNDAASPLADICDHVIPLGAGTEQSVAATKSFVSSVLACLALLAAWRGDSGLASALDQLPGQFARALTLDWTEAFAPLVAGGSLYTIGRGPSLAIAQEAALKFKETACLHAEAFSAAEVRHGPMSIVGEGFPVVGFLADDAARPSMIETLALLGGHGASVMVAGGGNEGGNRLPVIATGHPLTDALAMIVPFYGAVEALARLRGLDPDRPRHLKKVTETR